MFVILVARYCDGNYFFKIQSSSYLHLLNIKAEQVNGFLVYKFQLTNFFQLSQQLKLIHNSNKSVKLNVKKYNIISLT